MKLFRGFLGTFFKRITQDWIFFFFLAINNYSLFYQLK